MEQLLIFVVTGAGAGILAGLFGVGGGLIMVPALAFVLPHQNVPAEVYMQVAIGTSLAVISATSISSTLAHQRRGGVDWAILLRFAPGLAAGAIGGAFVADQLSGEMLKRIVGAGAVLVALQMALKREPAATQAVRIMPATPELLGIGGLIGLLSAIVGIGGGSLTVPYLSHRGLTMQRAVGTAAASGVPIAWAGATGFILAGWNAQGVPAPHLGYVSLSAFAALAVASVSCAPLGARLAHAASPQTLRRAFALLLTVVGLRMLLN